MDNTVTCKHSFWATISAEIEFDDSDFECIKQNMLHHYDFTVKASANVGGFWYGFNNQRTWARESENPQPDYDGKSKNLSQRELGLILKSLEMDHSDQANSISKRLYAIVRELQQKQEEVNKTLNEK